MFPYHPSTSQEHDFQCGLEFFIYLANYLGSIIKFSLQFLIMGNVSPSLMSHIRTQKKDNFQGYTEFSFQRPSVLHVYEIDIQHQLQRVE